MVRTRSGGPSRPAVPFLAVVAAVFLAGCGGGAHNAPRDQAYRPPATKPAASSPAAGLRARVLSKGEMAGFAPAGTSLYATAAGWIAGGQLTGAEGAMLKREGFRAGAVEKLADGPTQGLSLVEQFRSAGAARDALAFYLAGVKAPGSSAGAYAPFRVSGIPGAAGYSLGGNGGGINIAFSDGDYYYLVGREAGSPGATASLRAAALSLYQRVHRSGAVS